MALIAFVSEYDDMCGDGGSKLDACNGRWRPAGKQRDSSDCLRRVGA